MILADTSVWVDHFRNDNTPGARRLARALDEGEDVCICGVVLTEVLQGIRNARQRRAVRGALDALIYLLAPRNAYCVAADLFQAAQGRGRPVRSTIDCIIAAIALEHDAAVLHRDRDYDTLAEVSGLRVVRA